MKENNEKKNQKTSNHSNKSSMCVVYPANGMLPQQ